MDERASQANSFGPVAAVYERGRPPYPQEALDWLLPAGRPQVVDLGAGTGKLTRQVQARGLAVTAVDPSEGMLAELRRVLPGVPALPGTAESIPLPDAAADVVLCAQAWHWVDPERAVPEVARVLSPGGRLGLIWNLRDESVEWVHRLGVLIGAREEPHRTELGPPFGPAQLRTFAWSNPMDADRLVDLVASRSYVILMASDERAARLEQVRELAAELGDSFAMPYVTHCARADLQDGRFASR
jgi:SAM-dependent methyltransferase